MARILNSLMIFLISLDISINVNMVKLLSKRHQAQGTDRYFVCQMSRHGDKLASLRKSGILKVKLWPVQDPFLRVLIDPAPLFDIDPCSFPRSYAYISVTNLHV